MNNAIDKLRQTALDATYSTSNAFTGGSVLTYYNENLPLRLAPLNQSLEDHMLDATPVANYGSVKQNANATETFEQHVNTLLLRDRINISSRFNTLFTELIRDSVNIFNFSQMPKKSSKLIWANIFGDPIIWVYSYVQLESESQINVGQNFGDFSFTFNGHRNGNVSVSEITTVINALNKIFASNGLQTSPMLETIKANNNMVTLNGQKIQLGY